MGWSSPDLVVGVFHYPDSAPPTSATQLIANENNAMPFGLDVADFTTDATIQSAVINQATARSFDIQQAAQDSLMADQFNERFRILRPVRRS